MRIEIDTGRGILAVDELEVSLEALADVLYLRMREIERDGEKRDAPVQSIREGRRTTADYQRR